MEKHNYKSTGVALLLGALLIIATMTLHPSGGSMEHIIAISRIITISHGMAIACLPLLVFGFYGLTQELMDSGKLSVLALIIITFGLIAALFAALFNGLALPFFLTHYTDNLSEYKDILHPITTFSFSINKALDYIFIAASCLAISIYSVLMLKSVIFPKWLGYFGISLFIFVIIGVLTGFVFTNLTGFRIFTFSLAAWVLSAAILQIKTRKHEYE
ncbi:hypothetical protein [Spongiimicrobium salis]|uniref:hypothetical protein n=1 Tax=Spongiimicrobium salis TaxID=1667022 RepID=UPI00374D0B54